MLLQIPFDPSPTTYQVTNLIIGIGCCLKVYASVVSAFLKIYLYIHTVLTASF